MPVLSHEALAASLIGRRIVAASASDGLGPEQPRKINLTLDDGTTLVLWGNGDADESWIEVDLEGADTAATGVVWADVVFGGAAEATAWERGGAA